MNLNTRPVYDPSRVMEIPEAADRLRVSKKQINAWIEEGQLESYQIAGISDRMVVVPSIIPEFIAEQARRKELPRLVDKAPQSVDSPAPRNPELQDIDPSFLEAASKLLKTAEQIKRLVSTGTLVVVDGTITSESMAAYKEFLHS
jgi:excisionase family DNA binding protein